jgi:hypothetical protein
MTLDEELLARARTARERLVSLQHDAEIAQADYHYAIRVLHAGGGSMREIADALDLSHQRVHQVVDAGDPAAGRRAAERGDRERERAARDRDRAEHDRGQAERDRERAERDRERAERRKAQAEARRERTERRLTRRTERRPRSDRSGAEQSGPPGMPGVPGYDQLFADTRHVLDLARQEAVGFGHNYIGTESLLLGLIRANQGNAGRLLAAAGVDLETARAGVERIIGRGAETGDADHERPVPMTPRAAKVVELALREARHDRADLARGEHLLLALMREGKGVAAQILAEADFGRYDDVRRRLGRAGLRCSFCGRDGLRTDRLVAGPGVFVCRECVEDAGRLLAGEEPDSTEPADRLTLVAGLTEREAATCGFCGKPGAEVEQLVAGPDTAICAGCVELCGQIADELDGSRR